MSILQYKLRRISVPIIICESFTSPAHANCAPQFVGFETQCIKPETINSYIKLINNLIIFDANKHLLYPPFSKAYKEILTKNDSDDIMRNKNVRWPIVTIDDLYKLYEFPKTNIKKPKCEILKGTIIK